MTNEARRYRQTRSVPRFARLDRRRPVQIRAVQTERRPLARFTLGQVSPSASGPTDNPLSCEFVDLRFFKPMLAQHLSRVLTQFG